ncbi:hypothetical protein [Qipengyuania sediminis]|uniref:hypothetical protein n=1 Tax=Qipengyuania sediminis TaxID=1532023 RepID=UPI00105A6D4B|nr:hypothetical protein [Qipengyuania sediminis]
MANEHPEGSRRREFLDLCEETTGFGEIEWRTFRDLLIRPREALEAYLMHGPTGGRRYARPFGFYMGLCGILMFYLFLTGGLKGVIEAQPAAAIDGWVARSGKSREAFIDDAESWMSLVVTPIIAICNALLTVPFLKWWSGIDWRRSFRASYVLMCAWTVPILFLGPAPQMESFRTVAFAAMWAAFMVAFLRMGRGLWFAHWWEGVAKCLLLLMVLGIAGWLGMVPSLYIGLFGGIWSA